MWRIMKGNMLIQNGTMYLQKKAEIGDLRIKSGVISTIATGGGLEPNGEEVVIDATGLHLLPGAIYPHVHFRDPGHPEKEDLESGSRAAASGGITSFLDMPNNIPNAIDRTTIQNKLDIAAKKCVTHHGFFVGATKGNLADIQSVEGMTGVCGIKIFMGSSTGDLLVHEQGDLERIFSNTGGIIAVHAEDENRLQERHSHFEERTDIAAHAEYRDTECAMIATKRAVSLAKEHEHRLHIVHLTSAEEANWLPSRKGDLVTTEVCVQHLTFDDRNMEELGTRGLVNPPIRYEEDKEALWRRLHDGTIDCVVTDHAPHSLESKSVGYPGSPAGMPGVETSLPLMLTHAMNGRCKVRDVVRWMSEGPAKVYGMKNKGSLIEGNDGDLAIVDLDNWRIASDSETWTRVGWTPYDGMRLTGWPSFTVVDGEIIHLRESSDSLKGQSIGLPGASGRALTFS